MGRLRPSTFERRAEGQTISPVCGLRNCEPRMPGMMTMGGLPGRSLARSKMRTRSGVRRAPQPADASASASATTRVMSDE
jgi:hypothetical protein